MGRIRVRGARALLPLLVLGATLAGLPRAVAQDATPRVTLELLSQTAWIEPQDHRFGLRVLARNDGAARIGHLDVRLAIGPAFTSRNDYETWLVPGTTIEPSFTARFPFDGTIDPGAVRQFAVALDPATIGTLAPTDSRVYPLAIEVRSDGVAVGTLNTSLVSIVREPEAPVSLSWWTEFDAPLPLDAEGVLTDPAFEDAIDAGGGLAEQARAVATLADADVPIDLVVRPALLEQLVRMTDGYERTTGGPVPPGTGGASDAAALLATLTRAAAADSVQVSAMPFAGPSIPALLAGGLEMDLDAQRQLGNEWTREALDVTPAVAVARPPGGELSAEALAWYAAAGTRTILADPDAVERPAQENEYAFPSTATVETARGDVTLVLPDPGTQSLLERTDLLADPVLAAQAVFGELAVIWREQPVPPPPTVRGLALQLPTSLPPSMWQQLVGRLSRAPFLEPRHAQEHVAAVVPKGARGELIAAATEVFSAGYTDDIRRLRRDVAALASMYVEPSPQPERLRRNLYVAEASAYLDDELGGRSWLDGVATATSDAFGRLTPQVRLFTLTSREGSIPLLMGDPGPVPVAVTIELSSSGLRFPDGPQEVELEPGRQQVVTFPVEAPSAGLHQVRVSVTSPSGRVVSDQQVQIRSTALNAIALAVTGAAALVLFGLWLRRWFRRRTM